jgi:hypothetical protein
MSHIVNMPLDRPNTLNVFSNTSPFCFAIFFTRTWP